MGVPLPHGIRMQKVKFEKFFGFKVFGKDSSNFDLTSFEARAWNYNWAVENLEDNAICEY